MIYKFTRRYSKNRLFPAKDWKNISFRLFKKKYPEIEMHLFKDTDHFKIKEKEESFEIAQRLGNKWSIYYAEKVKEKNGKKKTQ